MKGLWKTVFKWKTVWTSLVWVSSARAITPCQALFWEFYVFILFSDDNSPVGLCGCWSAWIHTHSPLHRRLLLQAPEILRLSPPGCWSTFTPRAGPWDVKTLRNSPANDRGDLVAVTQPPYPSGGVSGKILHTLVRKVHTPHADEPQLLTGNCLSLPPLPCFTSLPLAGCPRSTFQVNSFLSNPCPGAGILEAPKLTALSNITVPILEMRKLRHWEAGYLNMDRK